MTNNKFNKTDTMNLSREEVVKRMTEDANFRLELVSENPYWFFVFYMHKYIKYPMAEFHKEMLEIIENQDTELAVITAFRGSGKSTLFTTLAPIWSVLGKPKNKFVVIASQTRQQAKQHFSNLKKELEDNDRLKMDLGPFEDKTEEWGQYGIHIKDYDARIIAVSTGQSIRGIRHGAHRPDLIICDDIDDLESVKTSDSRKQTYDWFKGDLIPAGDSETKIMVVGTPLHKDDLLHRLKEEIEEGKVNGTFKKYPLLKEDGKCLWRGKYPTKDDIKKERQKVNDKITWHREYLLKILPDKNQIVKRDWIQYYDKIPKNYKRVCVAIDPAISEKDHADKTAMVAVTMVGRREDMRMYIHPYPVNERLNAPDAQKKAKNLSETIGGSTRAELLIEDVAYQRALPQNLKHDGYPAKAVAINGRDKRARLFSIAPQIKNGQILFPKEGAEELINQVIDFGIEKHDDLVDALTLAVTKINEKDRNLARAWNYKHGYVT